ncbi:SRPBCC family protein [Jatrophihabitans sp. YIM 134969]
MSRYRVVRDYPQAANVVWSALTDPALVPLWTSTGRGGRPEGFAPRVGTEFRFVGKPFPGWDGVVRCEVTAVEAPRLLQYTWRNQPEDRPTLVDIELDPTSDGTRLTWTHSGFRGVGGLVMSTLLGRVRRTMMSDGLPAVLADLDAHGRLRPTSTLRALD